MTIFFTEPCFNGQPKRQPPALPRPPPRHPPLPPAAWPRPQISSSGAELVSLQGRDAHCSQVLGLRKAESGRPRERDGRRTGREREKQMAAKIG